MRADGTTGDTLTAKQAAERLGVQLASLYAYVSRGLIESVPGSGRARRYRRVDVERLLLRRGQREPAGSKLGGALRWGEPVLETAVGHVGAGGPVYRGIPALELAARATPFEAVAELLWTGALPETAPAWKADGLGLPAARLRALLPAGSPPLTTLAVAVPALAARDAGRFDRRPEATLPRARRLLRRMAAALALPRGVERAARALRAPTVAGSLAIALGAKGGASAAAALDLVLVLWADHELNVSTFATRVAASAGADLYSSVCAGLAALSGPKHGAACEQVEALVAEAGKPARAAAVLQARARRGETLPGFGHPLYPRGDPRAAPLLARAIALAPRDPRVRTLVALVDAVAAQGGPPANIDVGITAVAAALGLAPGLAPGVIAIGRAAGWVAHALEQEAAGFMIRPRARLAPVAPTAPAAPTPGGPHGP